MLGHELELRLIRSTGMFLYARLIIDYLSKQLFRTSEDLRGTIQELPPELKGLSVVTLILFINTGRSDLTIRLLALATGGFCPT